MSLTVTTAVGWMRRRAENVVAGLLGLMFLAFIIQIVFRYFFNFPIGWTSELSVITWLYMVLLGSAFWLKESEEVRFDLFSGGLGPRGRRVVGLIVAVAAVVLFGMAMPATDKLRRLHEGREQFLPKDPPRHPVFDLRRLRSGRDRPLSLGDREPASWRGAGRGRHHQGGLRTMNLTSPFALALVRHRRVERDRAARRLRDDRRFHPLAFPVGPRHGDRGRAVPERHDGKPAAARDPAVHPRRRVHEHRQHHGQAAALLQRDRRPLPRAGWHR